ncbi:MAG: biotin/lipoyl-containing protein, partial [bacterium]
ADMVARSSGVVELGQSIEICVPDIGDFEEVEVVEILVAPGDAVAFDDPLVSVESDKATMEIPASSAGVVTEVRVSEGDKVSEGSVLVLLDADADDSPRSSEEATAETASEAGAAAVAETGAEPTPDAAQSSSATPTSPAGTQESTAAAASAPGPKPTPRVMSAAASNPVPDRHGGPHASPLVRRYARELGVPVEAAEGTGPLG